jgi:hypothetical protein
MAERISRAEYAKRRNVSRSAVTKAVRSGRITLIDGQWIDPVAADAQWAHHTDPTQSLRASRGRAAVPAAPPAASPDPPPAFDGRGLLEAKRRREDALAAIAELELAEKRKVLVNVEQFLPEFERMVDAWRTELMGLPDRWVAELQLLHGIAVDPAFFERSIREACLQLSRYNPATHRFDAEDDPDASTTDPNPSRSD